MWRKPLTSLLVALACLLVVAGAFYVPYWFGPERARSTSYLADRVGGELFNNNLPNFLHTVIFYDSFAFVVVTGLLALASCCGPACTAAYSASPRRPAMGACWRLS